MLFTSKTWRWTNPKSLKKFKHNSNQQIFQDLLMHQDNQLILVLLLKLRLRLRHKSKAKQQQKPVQKLELPLKQLPLILLLMELLNILLKWNLKMVSLLMFLIKELEHNAKLVRLLRFNILVPLQQMVKFSIHLSQQETQLHLQLEKIELLDAGKMLWFNSQSVRKQILVAHPQLLMVQQLNQIFQQILIWSSTSKLSLANDDNHFLR